MAQKRTPEKSEQHANPPPTGAARWRNGGVVRRHTLSTGAVVLGVALLAGLLASWLLESQATARLVNRAPSLLRLSTQLVSRSPIQSQVELARLAEEFERIPLVRGCEIEVRSVLADGAVAPSSAPAMRYQSQPAATAEALRLSAPIVDAAGLAYGNMSLSFAAPEYAWWDARLWVGLTMIVLAAGVALFIFDRRAQRALRPLEQVQQNLLAYHDGVEPALDLLAVQGGAGVIADAWNTFIQGVSELRREVERFRCRDAIQSAHSGGARVSGQVLDRLPVGVVRLDERDVIVHANRAACTLLALESSAIGSPLVKSVRETEIAQTLISLRGSPCGATRDVKIKSGAATSVVRTTVLSGGTEELLLMLQDVSQTVEAEQARDEFLAHITHELRTPLTNIRAYTETLTQDFLDDEQTRRECYNVIMSETRRLTKLIEDVLSVSQIESGGGRLVRAPVRVEELLRQTMQEMQAAADAKQIKLGLKIPSKVPMVSGDKHRLHQVWTNLIGNAIKYTPEGRSVSVEVESEEGRLRTRVTDTGIGIAPEHHEKIFEKFYRVDDPGVAATEGTGLGLAITREILRMHGGSIRVESELGKGSTFVIDLPPLRSIEREAARKG
ncbi:MAG: ATP-binding protein [Phycisphaerae bacterium]|nr:ATP-binding protein [Phycisphaerae bacterium]